MKDAVHSIEETVGAVPWSRKLYRKRDADVFWKESEGLHYAYLIFRTLRGDYPQFQPDAVFYVGKSPAAYLKEVTTNKIPEDDVREWQRFLWNQTVVPMLIVQSRTQIQVYTAYTPPKEKDSQERITSILETVADTLELDQLLTAIEAGTIYEEKPEAFFKSYAVDRHLLVNLNVAAEQLAGTQVGGIRKEENLKFVHRFLTRLLFVCYIIERGMIKGEHFEDDVLSKLRPKTEKQEGYFIRHLFDDLGTYYKKRDALCKLFAHVKERFNGSLFPDNGVKGESDRYNEPFISILHRFLKAEELKKGQLTLGFWAYDFSVIPIETISAIYESFLGAQGKIRESLGEGNTKHTTGAYYTPLHLAELTVDIALEKVERSVHELTVLDPACGSGVFLVSFFGRMAESLRRKRNYSKDTLDNEWAFDLQDLLQKLYGIDSNPTACHITCFSLYLVLLEHLLPRDVEYLRELNENKKALQPLLAPHPKGYNTIYHDNLFNPKLALEKKDFDVVIGNPPWVSDKQNDKYFLRWHQRNPNVLGPDKQIAHGFMWKAPEYLADSGIACLLLPASVLFNDHTNLFQKEWFKFVAVEKVVNFSDLRRILFEDAIHPCLAVRFLPIEIKTKSCVCYEAPKTDIRSQKGGPIYVREEDISVLDTKMILDAAESDSGPALWKSYLWASWRDRRFLARLNDLPKLDRIMGKPDSNKELLLGRGGEHYTKNDKEKKVKPKKAWWDDKLRYIHSLKNEELIVNADNFIDIPKKFEKLRRSPNKKIFTNSKVLISRGASDIKIAYCPKPVFFSDSIQSIASPNNDYNLLAFLSAVMDSNVMQYYLFHTSTKWAIEREVIYLHELHKLPFFLPTEASDSKKAEEIVANIASLFKNFERKQSNNMWFGQIEKRKDEIKKIRCKIEPLVRDYYDIDKYETMLIEDTRDYAMESFHPRYNRENIPTLREADQKDQKIYGETLCEMLNHFGKGSSFKVNGEVIQGDPYSVVQVSLTDKIHKNVSVVNANDRLTEIFKRMKALLEEKQGRFVFCKNLKVFDGNDLYILKPIQMRFWTRTAALNDADEVGGALLKF